MPASKNGFLWTFSFAYQTKIFISCTQIRESHNDFWSLEWYSAVYWTSSKSRLKSNTTKSYYVINLRSLALCLFAQRAKMAYLWVAKLKPRGKTIIVKSHTTFQLNVYSSSGRNTNTISVRNALFHAMKKNIQLN